MATAGSITGLIIQTFKYIGKEHINNKHLGHIKQRLNEKDINHLRRNAHLAPIWIAKIIKSDLLGE